ncbi:type II toxin-antitoxin system MqsR family toxin [Acidithiobacillus thiooxidans]|uniref:type II toxin-antitoxin system MqsR family toxin n=1 Tax=Acidithiobacillus TaxID=119977 RepID=UPI000307FA7C|nr:MULTISPECIES: type II toxin-antitoxin system MqsR family toxin [Acidithiobacillus]MBU2740694.1 type II toxin-antitoxin system MqsR family toxin [Acidithiobacillus albertensis]MBU2811226.1 type II toxin-antitoxin system MqsR family toxin [Acidithiobacillus thiooxidans]MBU2836683.1 type II toxin-antitoxin system MqsR family toxin [Acidithiobacillus thiooxidans]MDR7927261.1 type II toxin-antitoxin system MqsR family toxin [Acidithiobacillus thiooxidans]
MVSINSRQWERKPHYPLAEIKAAITRLGRDTFAATTLRGIDLMGLTVAEEMAVVLGLQPEMLFMSMTTFADHRVWQDVYHAPCPNGKTAYIKVTLQSGAVVIQFKAL